jgi:sugar fermentation stimulation protein A
MRFDPRLVEGTLVRRYKRFLADVRLAGGELVTAHVPNTGSMRGCADPGSRVGLMPSPDPRRRLRFTLELVKVRRGWIGVNTARSNRIVEEAVGASKVPELAGYASLRTEVRYGLSSRVDLLLEDGPRKCYVEVKNATLKEGEAVMFPDAVTERGRKHLRELAAMARAGHRAVIFFLVNREDCAFFAPARHVDPVYGELLDRVSREGVEILAYRTRASLSSIRLDRPVPIAL